jgi:predicted regulator of Ras-like GTPase activity (Roadblock/LC7/MglB family)
MATKLEDILLHVIGDVDGALACAVVDITNGLLLAVAHSVPYFTQSYLDAVAAAAVDMFRGKKISSIESLLSTQRGQPVENAITEIQMTTEGSFHFMAIVPSKPHILMVLVTSRETALGMAWFEVRRNLSKIGELCP